MRIGIFGAGGFGREVLPEVKRAYPNANIKFVVDNGVKHPVYVNGVEVMYLDQAIAQKLSIVLAVGDGDKRKRLFEGMRPLGLNFIDVFADNVALYDGVKIGEGAVICRGSIITSNVEIGIGFQCNLYSYVAHDCVIGDFVTLAPRVCCNGNVRIEDGAYIGTGAMLRQGSTGKPLIIGRGSVVGMGAVVVRDVPPGCTVVGNPARILDK
jgi:sugar O-acyltransferase (sialic acid O-acetyltransferase NeuD family)